ncbi:LysR family transcriptional regulator [Pararhizobium sp. DWP1-1-3]|uniref:LysR family transcriptional regulator n=1 Tax=Pararhizobium sp. DWP1-1-3 TaxID=2804652 RepID=UPI003CF3FF08
MLHSRVLRYIDEVARCGSIRAAGERLNVAPSAINKHILQLEEAIGEPLFERLPRGLRLTPAGEILVAHVRRTIKEFSQVEADIRDMKTLQSGDHYRHDGRAGRRHRAEDCSAFRHASPET